MLLNQHVLMAIERSSLCTFWKLHSFSIAA